MENWKKRMKGDKELLMLLNSEKPFHNQLMDIVENLPPVKTEEEKPVNPVKKKKEVDHEKKIAELLDLVERLEKELPTVTSKSRENSLKRTLRKHWAKIEGHREALEGVE